MRSHDGILERAVGGCGGRRRKEGSPGCLSWSWKLVDFFAADTTGQGSAVPGEWQGEGDAAGVCDWAAQVPTAAIGCRGVHVKWEKQMP